MRFFYVTLFLIVLLSVVHAQEFETGCSAPYEKQEGIMVGGRIQRVRFFLSNDSNIDKLIRRSPMGILIDEDRTRNIDNSEWSYYGAITYRPVHMEIPVFSEESHTCGLIVNIPLVSCAVKLFELVKLVGDNKKQEFEKFKIDEINIFLKPVRTVQNTDYKLSIDPAIRNVPEDPALNVQIPIVMPGNSCMLPSKQALTKAFEGAACKGATMNYCKK